MWALGCLPTAHAGTQRWGCRSVPTATFTRNVSASRRQCGSAPPAAAAGGNTGVAAAAAAAELPVQCGAAAAFRELGAATLEACSVLLAPCGPQGNGLVATAAAAPGDILLRVPMPACLVVDYAAGLRVPPGAWPRLRKGVQKDDSLPWDVLQVRAGGHGLLVCSCTCAAVLRLPAVPAAIRAPA